MAESILIELQVPGDLGRFKLPSGVQTRLQEFLDRQDRGQPLTEAERDEAEGLVSLAELLSLLRLRAERTAARSSILPIREEELERGRHPPPTSESPA